MTPAPEGVAEIAAAAQDAVLAEVAKAALADRVLEEVINQQLRLEIKCL